MGIEKIINVSVSLNPHASYVPYVTCNYQIMSTFRKHIQMFVTHDRTAASRAF